jgi:glycosyltransferase involved in cell wall biosynthesis
MHVLVVSPYLPDPPDRGSRIRSRVLVDALAQRHTVHLAVPEAEARTFDERIRVHGLSGAAPRTSGTARKLRRWLGGQSEVLERRFGPAARAEIEALLTAHPFGAVVADSSFVLPLLPTRLPAPLVVHLHNVESALLRRPGTERPPFADRLQRRLEGRLIRRAERIATRRAVLTITVSSRDRAHVADFAPAAAVEVVENSIDVFALPVLSMPSDEAPPLLLFVGALDYPPNREAVRELVTVHAPFLRRHRPDLRIRVVGHDPDGEITALIRDGGCEATGFVPDLLPHYAEATCVYLPIRSGGGTRIKVLEAFAVGRPVLATEVAVEGLGLSDGREYLRFETPGEGLASIDHVRRGDVSGLIARGRTLAERRFDHAVARRRLADAFDRAVGPRHDPR